MTSAAAYQEKAGAWMEELPEAPLFTPSRKEWEDPMAYIASIRPMAAKFGKLGPHVHDTMRLCLASACGSSNTVICSVG